MNLEKDRKQCYVYSAITSIIAELPKTTDSPTKALLANLRNSIGRENAISTAVFPILLKHIPDEYLGRSQHLTNGEKAIINTMQLYALFSQGRLDKPYSGEFEKWENIGTSFSLLRLSKENKIALDRRFNVMVTSTTYEELIYHLRQMFGILKSNKLDIKINFPKLGSDLLDFLNGNLDVMKIAWAREYYRNRNFEIMKGNGEENE